MSSTTARIPSLDGLRAFSIALVIIAHTYGGLFSSMPDDPVWVILTNGSLGVEVFFVISGFLITSIIAHDLGTPGRKFSLATFYERRVRRIFPAPVRPCSRSTGPATTC
jgi:peptidoglycan/LPS O-acetylase OafA/YrhL